MLWYSQDRRKVHACAAITQEACVGTGSREAELSFGGSTWNKSRYLFLLVHLVGLVEGETTFHKSNNFFSYDAFRSQVFVLNEEKRHECTLTSTNDALKEICLWGSEMKSTLILPGRRLEMWGLIEGVEKHSWKISGREGRYNIYCEEHVIQSSHKTHVSPIKHI